MPLSYLMLAIFTGVAFGGSEFDPKVYQDLGGTMLGSQPSTPVYEGTHRDMVNETQREAKDVALVKALSKKFYADYCKDGKQVRPLMDKVIAILPKPQKGLPVDKVERVKKSIQSVALDTASKFMWYSAFTDQGKNLATEQRIFAIEDNSEAKLISKFESLEVPVEFFEEGRSFDSDGGSGKFLLPSAGNIDSNTAMTETDRANFIFLRFKPGTPAYLIFFSGLSYLPKQWQESRDGMCCDMVHISKSGDSFAATLRNANEVSDTSNEFPVRTWIDKDGSIEKQAIPNYLYAGVERKIKIVNKDNAMGKVYPLWSVHHGELSFFRQAFTFMMPKSAQDKLIDVKDDCYMTAQRGKLWDYNYVDKVSGVPLKLKMQCDKTRFYLGLGDDEKPAASKALEDRERFWDVYMAKFTKVKATSTKDPQVYTFDYALDLNPFCQYARPITDLVTQ